MSNGNTENLDGAVERKKPQIRAFQPGDELAFRRLNEEWITRYFVLEAKDRQSLLNPQATVRDGGGEIFFAIVDVRIVGCCALISMATESMASVEFEVSKMAVTESAQGLGIGRALLTEVIEQARSRGATRLYIETNAGLAPALKLYDSLGFRRVPPERHIQSPYARADVYLELFL